MSPLFVELRERKKCIVLIGGDFHFVCLILFWENEKREKKKTQQKKIHRDDWRGFIREKTQCDKTIKIIILKKHIKMTKLQIDTETKRFIERLFWFPHPKNHTHIWYTTHFFSGWFSENVTYIILIHNWRKWINKTVKQLKLYQMIYLTTFISYILTINEKWINIYIFTTHTGQK